MLSKQTVWRCGRGAFLFLSISCSLSTIFVKAGGSFSRFEPPSEVEEDRPTTYSAEEYGGYSKEFLEKCHEGSSRDVNYIINFLKDPKYALGEEDRFSFFYGRTGAGKTIQSFVIPYIAGWRCADRVPSQLQVKERNGTARNITDDIAHVLEPGEKVVYIIQEFNRLVDHANSTSHDADTASTALWTALDKYNKNPNIYFIFTSNSLENIPQQLKDRCLPQVVEFEGFQSFEEKKSALKDHILGDRVQFGEDCTESYIDSVVRKCSPVTSTSHEEMPLTSEQLAQLYSLSTHRDCRAIGILTRRFARFDNPTGYHAAVTQKHLDDAIEKIAHVKKLCHYGKDEETDYVQRERHHYESILQSYELHALNIQQDILRTRHTTMMGGISDNGLRDIYRAQPEAVQRYIHFNETHGVLGTLRRKLFDASHTTPYSTAHQRYSREEQ